MTRLEAIRYIRTGKALSVVHEGIESTFRANISEHAFKPGKVRCIFVNVKPWGGMFGVVITPKQVLSYIKRNFPRK